MTERTKGPWKWHSRLEQDLHNPCLKRQTGSVFSEPIKGHAYSVAIAPQYQTEERWKADAAAIVRWENHFDELVKALEELIPTIRSVDQETTAAIDRALAALRKAKS